LIHDLEGQKKDVIDGINRTSSLLDATDWAMALAQGIEDAQQVPPQLLPLKLAYGGISTLYNKFNDEPGFSDIDPNNDPRYKDAQINKIERKKDFVNNTDYKYYIADSATDYGPGIGPHMSFISKLKKKAKELQNKPQYETQEEREIREAYIGYLNQIIELNEKGDLAALSDEFRKIDSD
jgi:hypothetical protein